MTMDSSMQGSATATKQFTGSLKPRQLGSPAKIIAQERLSRSELPRGVDGLGVRSSTTPVRIASQSPARMHALLQSTAEVDVPKLNFEEVRKRAAKKRRRKGGIKPGAPAVKTIRGFETPVTSGDEGTWSGASTPRMLPIRDFSSVTSSPALQPCTPASGISQLRMQLDSMSSGQRTPTTSPPLARAVAMCRDFSNDGSETNGSERSELDTYEVPLESDFVSPDANAKPAVLGPVEGGLRHNSMARKMTAADFETLTCLGKGSFGTVLLVKQHATGRLFAQKQFKKASLVVHKHLIEQTKTERHILESVNRHPFVVKLYYAFQDHEKLYLILEYGQGGELFHHLAMERMFTAETAAFYMAELVLALDHLHNTLGVIYRDLKPENCLLDAEGHLLLTDFGLSKVAVDEEKTTSILGTVSFMAPEVVQGEEYGMAVDWWSLGALGFDMLTGSPPFTGNNNKKIQDKIVKGKIQMPYFLNPDAKDLLTRLLRKNPRQRLGYNMPKDLDTIKAHRFFKGIDWKKLARRELTPPIQPLITDPELAENFSREFTDMPLSPVASRCMGFGGLGIGAEGGFEGGEVEKDPFGGFSFVASQSLLEDAPLF